MLGNQNSRLAREGDKNYGDIFIVVDVVGVETLSYS